MNKILFLEWKSFGNDYIIKEFERNGYEVMRLPFARETEDIRNGKELTEQLAMTIMREAPSFVFSFNYFPVAAIACRACRIKYVSWIYDSPYILMYSKTIFYETNRVFVFDQSEVLKLRQMGVSHIYYLPMAAAVEDYDKMDPGETEHKKYDSDITFIGSMYSETKQHMFRHLEELDDYTKGYLFGLMEAQKNLYGMDILECSLKPELIETMQKVCPVTENGDGLESVGWVFANYFLARKVTEMERREVMERLSMRYKVKLFTPEKTPHLPNVENMGEVDYYLQAPYAMKCAKINLNISLRSIHSGIPLRAIDIMGCGGFLITNFQSDFLEYFEPGVDFVYYESQENLEELVDYYLEHEEERKQIALNGYRKVKEYLTYEKQVGKMLDMI